MCSYDLGSVWLTFMSSSPSPSPAKRTRSLSPTSAHVSLPALQEHEGQAAYRVVASTFPVATPAATTKTTTPGSTTCSTAAVDTMMAVSAQDVSQLLRSEPGQASIHQPSLYHPHHSGSRHASHGSLREDRVAAALSSEDLTAAWSRYPAGRASALAVSLAPTSHPAVSALPGCCSPTSSCSLTASCDLPGALDADMWRQGKPYEDLDLERYAPSYGRSGQACAAPEEGVVDLRFALSQLEEQSLQPGQAGTRNETASPFSPSACTPNLDLGAIDDAHAHVGPPGAASTPEYVTSLTPVAAASVGFPLPSSPHRGWWRPEAGHGHDHGHDHDQRGRPSASSGLRVQPPSNPTGSAHTSRWSTASSPASPECPFPSAVYPTVDTYQQLAARHLSFQSSPLPHHTRLMPRRAHLPTQPRTYVTSQPQGFERPPACYPPPFISPVSPISPGHGTPLEHPPLLPSSHGFHPPAPLARADLRSPRPYPGSQVSGPPDLFASLRRQPTAPPARDMSVSDPDLLPHEQDLRSDGDLYTPRWVRGQGNKREGWCGLCEPGRWLVLKNSAFWYDKSFTHGIAATGTPFRGPQATRRMDGNPDVWEGYCGSCHDWIALVSSKKKGTTWFRHAYKVGRT